MEGVIEEANGSVGNIIQNPSKGRKTFFSSLGIKYPTNRDHFLHSGEIWLRGRRMDEGAEGLWRIHDDLYDLTKFSRIHPGGKDWIEMTKGTDITEAYETYHINTNIVEKLLPKFQVRQAKSQRIYPFTFHENGFYKTLKRRIRGELEEIPYKFVAKSKNIADSLFVSYVILAWLATLNWNFLIGFISGIILSYTAIAAHNFFHKRDNLRMFYFDFCMMSSREWRISHALSHHLFTNTINDLEISSWEPLFYWLPFKKNFFIKYVSWMYCPIPYAILFYTHWIKTMLSNIFISKEIPLRSFLPFSIIMVQYFGTNKNLSNCIVMFLWIIASASFHFSIVAINAGHQDPMLFHDGDASRPKEELDFGVYQLDAVADRNDVMGSPFLILTHFGDHALHHLFPSVDHGKLKFLYPTFLKTCEEFGIHWKCTSQLHLFKAQFLQLARDVNEEPPEKLIKRESI